MSVVFFSFGIINFLILLYGMLLCGITIPDVGVLINQWIRTFPINTNYLHYLDRVIELRGVLFSEKLKTGTFNGLLSQFIKEYFGSLLIWGIIFILVGIILRRIHRKYSWQCENLDMRGVVVISALLISTGAMALILPFLARSIFGIQDYWYYMIVHYMNGVVSKPVEPLDPRTWDMFIGCLMMTFGMTKRCIQLKGIWKVLLFPLYLILGLFGGLLCSSIVISFCDMGVSLIIGVGRVIRGLFYIMVISIPGLVFHREVSPEEYERRMAEIKLMNEEDERQAKLAREEDMRWEEQKRQEHEDRIRWFEDMVGTGRGSELMDHHVAELRKSYCELRDSTKDWLDDQD